MHRPAKLTPHLTQRLFAAVAASGLTLGFVACSGGSVGSSSGGAGGGVVSHLEESRSLFREGTLGMEAFWSDAVGLDTGLARAEFSTLDALRLGLNLDSTVMNPATLADLTSELAGNLSQGTIDTLSDPFVFESLLGQGAVVGLVGVEVDGVQGIALDGPDSVAISCALCHSIVDGSAYSGPALAGSIGVRMDGPAPSSLRVGALLALADRSSVLYPFLPQSHATIGGMPIARTGGFVEASSTEAEVDALLSDTVAFPAGLWDATPDGIGNPTVLPPVYEIRAAAPYGIAGEFTDLMDAINAHGTLGLDPTTLLTPLGMQFMNRVGLGIGTEIVNEYEDVFAGLGAMVPVGGLPYIDAEATGLVGDESSPVGFRMAERDLQLYATYLQSLTEPVRSVGNVSARARGAAAYALTCATCHGAPSSPAANEMVSLLDLVVPYAPTTLLARGFPYSDVLDDRLRTYDDRLVLFDRVYSNIQVPAAAREFTTPNLRGLHVKERFLHDGSVLGLDALLDPARGAGQPHPYFVETSVRADLIEFLTAR